MENNNEQNNSPPGDKEPVDFRFLIKTIIFVILTCALAFFESAYFIADIAVLGTWGAKYYVSSIRAQTAAVSLHLVTCFFFVAACTIGILSAVPKFSKMVQLALSFVFIGMLVILSVAQFAILLSAIVLFSKVDFVVLALYGVNIVGYRAGYGFSFTFLIILPSAIILVSVSRIISIYKKPE
jgi:CDP-diglyceride synthetase